MAQLQTFYYTFITPMTDGIADTAGIGEKWEVSYTGTPPASGDSFTVSLIDSQSSTIVQVGGGDTTEITPSYCMAFGGKEYILAGQSVYFSALDDATTFNDPDGIGNGYVLLTDQINTPEDVVSIVPFQGRLAFLSRQSIQIWSTPTDPTQWSRIQTLENIGTIAKASVKPKGDLDALFLSDTGIRSLRARETTLNAFVDDLGSPIDPIIQPIVAANQSDAANACAVVEPTTGNYWLFLKDTIYVLSYYPSAKIIAWSKYEPRDSAGNLFTPEKFIVYKGQVYCRAGNKVYQYGGANRMTYDANAIVTAELPWLDLKKPGTNKTARSINVAFAGTWTVSIGMDPQSGILEPTPFSGSSPSYDIGMLPLNGYGSHFKAKMVSSGTRGTLPNIFSSLVFHYEENDET